MRGFELGATDYIIKPIRRKELLLSRIRNALNKRENRKGYDRAPEPDKKIPEV
jgi:DNA-binding response OmpR family regulator